MGHVRLGVLPKTLKWQDVVDLLGGEGDVDAIAAATSEAAETALKHASDDPALVNAIWLLCQIPLAARSDDFVGKLRELGLNIGDNPSLLEVVSAYSDAVDARVRQDAVTRTDLGELAQLSGVEVLTSTVGQRLPSLFGTSADDVRAELAKLATTKQFSLLARDFFGRLTERYLSYFLSREIPNHVGGDRRLKAVDEHTEFNKALELHCRQASRIVEEFAGGWFSKTNFEGGITPENARGFAYIAFKKIRAELIKRRETDE